MPGWTLWDQWPLNDRAHTTKPNGVLTEANHVLRKSRESIIAICRHNRFKIAQSHLYCHSKSRPKWYLSSETESLSSRDSWISSGGDFIIQETQRNYSAVFLAFWNFSFKFFPSSVKSSVNLNLSAYRTAKFVNYYFNRTTFPFI